MVSEKVVYRKELIEIHNDNFVNLELTLKISFGNFVGLMYQDEFT